MKVVESARKVTEASSLWLHGCTQKWVGGSVSSVTVFPDGLVPVIQSEAVAGEAPEELEED